MTKLELTDRDSDPEKAGTPRRRSTDRENGDWVRVRWSLVVQIIGYVTALLLVYNSLTNRMTAMEIRGDAMRSDIAEMKADVKTLLMRKP